MTGPVSLGGLGLGAVGLVLALAGPAAAGPVPGPSHDSDGCGQLKAAVATEGTLPFQGTEYLTTWLRGEASTVLTDVTHVPGRGTWVRAASTGGEAGSRMLDADPVELTDEAVDQLCADYRLVAGPGGNVADRPTTLIAVQRPDGSVAGRFWVDRHSGLLLGREIADERGTVVRSSAYVDISLGGNGAGQAVPAADAVVSRPWQTRLSADQLRAGGWVVPSQVGGLSLYDARLGKVSSGPVLHLAYTDGLSTVSVFEQRGRLDTGRLAGWQPRRMGGADVWMRDTVPTTLAWSGDGRVFTVVADAPPRVVRAGVTALPHHHPAAGFWSRLWDGLGRVGAWLDPFD